MLRVAFLVLSLIFLTFSASEDTRSNVNFTIGALLSSPISMMHFNSSISDVRAHVNEKQISFTALIEILASNAVTATKQLCSMISAGNARLFAVVVSNPPNSPMAPPHSISYIAALYGLPVIGVSARQAAFSNKYAHASFLRTVPPYVQEATIWAQLIGVFEWHEVIVIHSDINQDSKALIARLEAARQAVDFKIAQTIGVNTDEEDVNLKELQHKLEPIRRGQTRVVLLFVTRRYAEHVFTVAHRLGIIGTEWAWIISEQCLDAKNLPLGVLSVRLAQSDELLHVEDAARVVTEGIIKFVRREPDAMFGLQSVHHCRQELESPRNLSQSWLHYNTKLYQAMTEVIFEDGETGHVEFDSHGDRVGALYDIVNVQPHSDCSLSKPFCKPVINTVGSYSQAKRGSKKPQFSIETERIYWPGNYRIMKPSDICTKRNYRTNECIERAMRPRPPPSSKKKTHLKVVTIRSTPFVNYVPKSPGGQCNTSDRVEDLKFQVPCTHTNATTGKVTEYCCYGYCIDLLRHLSNRSSDPYENATSFTYELHLVGDGQMGEELVSAMNETKVWSGIVGELTTGMADLSVAPMTITPERVTIVEFTKPFKYLGVTILVKRERFKSNLASFLQPFESTLWVLVGVSVHVVALFLYLLDHYSAIRVLHRREREQTTKSTSPANNNPINIVEGNQKNEDVVKPKDDEEFNLSSSMWFTWGILLNSGIGDETPKAFSTRALGMVWAGFAMIIVASYTANLAAFLVLDRPEASISGIDDPRLRNPQKDFTFATVRGSPVDMYFKNQMELDTVYRTMEGRNVDSAEEGIQAVKKGTLKAFIWDSARLNYEASKDCDLVTTGDVFGRTGYGLAMKKGNPWIYELSQAVLSFHERGIMEQLDAEWIFNSGENEKCAKTESSAATLELTNMVGVFILVAVGIIAGLVLLLVEIACNRRKGIRARQIACAQRASGRWRKKIERKHRRPAPGDIETSSAPVFVDECIKPMATSSSIRVDYRLPQAVQISSAKTNRINNLTYQQLMENATWKTQRAKIGREKKATFADESVKNLQV